MKLLAIAFTCGALAYALAKKMGMDPSIKRMAGVVADQAVHKGHEMTGAARDAAAERVEDLAGKASETLRAHS